VLVERVVETAHASLQSGLPYVSGLFAWRELLVVLAPWRRLRVQPERLLVDGRGRAHPRRCDLACLLGLAVDVPTIGCAKSVLVGSFSGLAAARGARAPVVHAGEVDGAALRTRTGVRPVIVSVGHRVTLAAACSRVLAASRFRIPEPLRAAHAAARRHAGAERTAGRDGG
jgi:deoxyribonuclease V